MGRGLLRGLPHDLRPVELFPQLVPLVLHAAASMPKGTENPFGRSKRLSTRLSAAQSLKASKAMRWTRSSWPRR